MAIPASARRSDFRIIIWAPRSRLLGLSMPTLERGNAGWVMPAGGVKDDLPPSPTPPQDEARRDRDNNGGNGGRNPPGLHPFIQGLLDTLPSIPNPREKPEWPAAERAKWLQTAD